MRRIKAASRGHVIIQHAMSTMPTILLPLRLLRVTRQLAWAAAFSTAFLAGCAATSDNMGAFLSSPAEAFAVVDGRILRGQARLSAERDGMVMLQSIDSAAALSCFGPLRYTATVEGVINLQCSDARNVSLAFLAISPLSGTGRGTMEKTEGSAVTKTDVTLTYGLSADSAAAFLAVARDRLLPPAAAGSSGSSPDVSARATPAN